VHLLTDGQRIAPEWLGPSRIRFLLPSGQSNVELISRGFVPAHTRAASADLRELGICVGRLQLDGLEIPLDEAGFFARGWQALECYGGHQHRWTRARTPLPSGVRRVVIDLAGRGHYWSSPLPITGSDSSVRCRLPAWSR
jgi:hypothetical protein